MNDITQTPITAVAPYGGCLLFAPGMKIQIGSTPRSWWKRAAMWVWVKILRRPDPSVWTITAVNNLTLR